MSKREVTSASQSAERVQASLFAAVLRREIAAMSKNVARAEAEWRRIVDGVARAEALGLEIHAGHGLDYATAEQIAALAPIVELNIGHFLIGEAVFAGLAQTVAQMRAAMERGRKKAKPA